VAKVKESLKLAPTSYKSYNDKRRYDLNLKVDDYVYLELEVGYSWYHPSEAP
jgi:hypothetical protein